MRIVAVASSFFLCLCHGRRVNVHRPAEDFVDISSYEERQPLKQLAWLLAANAPPAAFSAPPSSRSIASAVGKGVALRQRAAAPRVFFGTPKPKGKVSKITGTNQNYWQRTFENWFPPDVSPFDVYNPDFNAKPATMPMENPVMVKQAIEGVVNALKLEEPAVEVAFPYSAEKGEGVDIQDNTQAGQLLFEANRDVVEGVLKKIGRGRNTVVVAFARCGIDGAKSLKQAQQEVASWQPGGVIFGVAPANNGAWQDLRKLADESGAQLVVINAKGNQDYKLPHAYCFFKIASMGSQLGGCVRVFPGPYEIYDILEPNRKVLYDVQLERTGNRAGPALAPVEAVLLYGGKQKYDLGAFQRKDSEMQ